MKYFKIRELIPCVDGHCRNRRCGYGESTLVEVPTEVIKNAIALVEEVLDPLRAQYGKPIKVNSGYRCPLKNKAVGGVAHSQHLLGEAADITALPHCGSASTDPHCGLASSGPHCGLASSGPHCGLDPLIAGGDPRSLNLALARILAEQGRFDQMILYVDKADSLEPRFIHVSYKRTGINRHRILKKVNGSRQYTPVLIADLIPSSRAETPSSRAETPSSRAETRDLKEIPGQARNEGTAEKGGAS